MDVFDRAQQRDEDDRALCLANALAQANRAGGPLSHCKECGEPIPLARQKAVTAVSTCVQCATELERFSKQFKRT
jgi:phage/conjugal plasmid C-4 type zinc finger TraR family protein